MTLDEVALRERMTRGLIDECTSADSEVEAHTDLRHFLDFQGESYVTFSEGEGVIRLDKPYIQLPPSIRQLVEKLELNGYKIEGR